MAPKSLPNHPLVHLLLLLWFVLPPWLVPAVSSVWDANEAFYVQTPREMVESGEWISPTFNGQPRLNKPPLAYWPVAVLYAVFGVSLLWERLVLAGCATACILLTWRLGVRMHGPIAGLVAAGILSATFRFQILSRRLLIDILLLALILGAFLLLHRWLESGRRRDFVLGCAVAGLGFLAKGPVAVAPIAIVAAYVLWRRRGQLRSIPWISGASSFLVIALSWPLALVLTQGIEPIWNFLFTENVGRFLNVDYGPRRGNLFYLGVFFADFLPWSLLVPAAVWAWTRGERAENGRLLLLWMASFLVVFSFSLNKQEYYILPVYPAAALFLAITAVSKAPGWGRWSGGLALGAAALVVAASCRSLFPDQPYLVLLSVPLIPAAWLLVKGRLLAAALCLAGFYSTAAVFLSGPLEAYKPVRPLAETMRKLSSESTYRDARLGYYRFTAPSLRFYVNRNIWELYDLQPALQLWESGHPVLLITDDAGLEDLSARSAITPEVLDQGNRLSTNFRSMLGGLTDDPAKLPVRSVYLLGNRPAPAPLGQPFPSD